MFITKVEESFYSVYIKGKDPYNELYLTPKNWDSNERDVFLKDEVISFISDIWEEIKNEDFMKEIIYNDISIPSLDGKDEILKEYDCEKLSIPEWIISLFNGLGFKGFYKFEVNMFYQGDYKYEIKKQVYRTLEKIFLIIGFSNDGIVQSVELDVCYSSFKDKIYCKDHVKFFSEKYSLNKENYKSILKNINNKIVEADFLLFETDYIIADDGIVHFNGMVYQGIWFSPEEIEKSGVLTRIYKERNEGIYHFKKNETDEIILNKKNKNNLHV